MKEISFRYIHSTYRVYAFIITGFLLFQGCGNPADNSAGKYLSDTLSLTEGEKLFTEQCTSCHNFKMDGIGPQLSGITETVSAAWISSFINDPAEMIKNKDERAVQLSEKYKTIMPAFNHLGQASIDKILAFIHTKKEIPVVRKLRPDSLTDPIPSRIPMSDLVLDLELMAQFPVTNEKAPITRITSLFVHPDNHRFYVLDLQGKLYVLKGKTPQVFMDMAALKPDFINKPGLATGFGSFAFHPEFKRNGLIYTTHTENPKVAKPDFGYPDSIRSTVQWVLTEWKMMDPEAEIFKGEGRELFRINMVTGIHGVQEIAFNPLAKKGDDDFGLLYVGVGDGGSVEVGYPFLVEGKEMLWGTILRIDPLGRNSKNGKYGIPDSNPFVKDPGVKSGPEVYCYGFRNPHRFTWLQDGRILASNIGNGNIEAVYLVEPGSHFGWPRREGSFELEPENDMNMVYPLPAGDSLLQISYPVIEYDHDEGKAIAGGYQYTGERLALLKGKFVFADMNNGRVFFVPVTEIVKGKQAAIQQFRLSLKGKEVTLMELCGTSPSSVQIRLGRDDKGELYITSKPDGKLYRITGVHK